ncbi:MAG: hypothetical protein SOH81_07795 [Acetobacter sp.]|jgi:hypothetical protein
MSYPDNLRSGIPGSPYHVPRMGYIPNSGDAQIMENIRQTIREAADEAEHLWRCLDNQSPKTGVPDAINGMREIADDLRVVALAEFE